MEALLRDLLIGGGDQWITVTDASGQSKTATFSVKQPDPLNASASAESPASTGGADGQALAQAQGGQVTQFVRPGGDLLRWVHRMGTASTLSGSVGDRPQPLFFERIDLVALWRDERPVGGDLAVARCSV